MRNFPALCALVRVEWRQLSRNVGRSLLVVALVAVAVAAIVGGSTLLRVTERTPEEWCTQTLGQAELAVRLDGEEDRERLRSALPETVRGSEVRRDFGDVRVPGLKFGARVFSGEFDGLAAPFHQLGFNIENHATGWCPGHTRYHTGTGLVTDTFINWFAF